jgi:hypothetical protein
MQRHPAAGVLEAATSKACVVAETRSMVVSRTVFKTGTLPKVEEPARACSLGQAAEARSQAHVTAHHRPM